MKYYLIEISEGDSSIKGKAYMSMLQGMKRLQISMQS